MSSAAHQASNIDVINGPTAEKSDLFFFFFSSSFFIDVDTIQCPAKCDSHFYFYFYFYFYLFIYFFFFICYKHTQVCFCPFIADGLVATPHASSPMCVSLNSFLFLSGPILWVGGSLEMGHGENMGKVLAA
jgi:hypothetical protein